MRMDRVGMEAGEEGKGEGGSGDEGKGGWLGAASVSSLLKHSCLLCWSPRDKDFVEQDECVAQKTGEIRDLQDAVQQEGIELEEQRGDRRELEETLEKLEQHRMELEDQLKLTRLECVQESQQILSLQAEEVARETKVEEYERELARARRKLKQLKMEVRRAQGKVEEAGERTIPLEESISQSYEEILQEEQTLSILRSERTGDATLPDHQQVEPIDTSPSSLRTEDGTLDVPAVPARSWGRSQSLPVYAEILANLGCAARAKNGLADTQEEEEETITPSTPKQKDKGEKEEKMEDEEKISQTRSTSSIAVEELDFYHPDPFIHCESEHYLFKDDDLFAKTDKSDDDPFKGTDPFAADILFPEGSEEPYPSTDPDTRLEPGSNDETDNSLSCAENKASTGTQCFESEFPDEDESSDIEISYSREDLDTVHTDAVELSFVEPQTLIMTERLGFKPIYAAQTCSLETELDDADEPGVASGREPFSQASRANTWAAGPNFSTESDPNGYEFDINAVSPPSDIEEIDITLGSIPVDFDLEPPGYDSVEPSNPVGIQACDSEPAGTGGCDLPVPSPPVPTRPVRPPRRLKGGASADLVEEPDTPKAERCDPGSSNPSADSELDSAIGMDPLTSSAEHNSKFSFGNNSFELNYEPNYEPSSQTSYNYGFKLSPEHHSEEILDPFAAELSDEEADNQASFDPYEFEPTAQSENQDVFDPYGFGHTSHATDRDTFDPYGFKLLSFETDNQSIVDLHSSDDTNLEDNNNTNKRDSFSFDFSNAASMDPYSSEPSNTATMDLLGLELSRANSVAESDCNNPTVSDPLGTVQTMAAGSNLLDLDLVFGSSSYSDNPEVTTDLYPCESRPGNPAGPNNFQFRVRDTAHSESVDTVSDWTTAKSNSRESLSFGPVKPRTHSLDK
ncbi:dentin sialophosphoprotein-like isoform X1 [Salvelinus fontinalis]|uniref:dentin sialophosphoprotein-like isoform X1 n=1 Tax=Salvelinus fontinalis TaxID=8038 RepID=UPI002485F5F0|nr:dentin sialophosphoprotein-like isoform X1 [Salvelinus fontinalis]